jgi:hypothetical protein
VSASARKLVQTLLHPAQANPRHFLARFSLSTALSTVSPLAAKWRLSFRNSAVNRIFHISYSDPDYPIFRLPSVYCISLLPTLSVVKTQRRPLHRSCMRNTSQPAVCLPRMRCKVHPFGTEPSSILGGLFLSVMHRNGGEVPYTVLCNW